MFSEKVNQVFDLLKVTSVDFARIAECDKSHISRMANGARVPKNGGAGGRRLVNGTYLCADERGKTDTNPILRKAMINFTEQLKEK